MGDAGMAEDALTMLARRAVACRRWTYQHPWDDPRGGSASSIRDVDGVQWRWIDRDGTCWRKPKPGEVQPTWLPDLADPATLGCLIGLVAHAGDAVIYDAAALVTALEADNG